MGKTNIPSSDVGIDYMRQPYLDAEKGYLEKAKRPMLAATQAIKLIQESELAKPYRDNSGGYPAMEAYAPQKYNSPYINFPVSDPWGPRDWDAPYAPEGGTTPEIQIGKELPEGYALIYECEVVDGCWLPGRIGFNIDVTIGCNFPILDAAKTWPYKTEGIYMDHWPPNDNWGDLEEMFRFPAPDYEAVSANTQLEVTVLMPHPVFTWGYGWVIIPSCCDVLPFGDLSLDGSPETITRNSSVNMVVSGGGGYSFEMTWEVTGTGFSIDDSGQLSADGSACGSATVTVTDLCDDTATHTVRCTSSGSWVDAGDKCAEWEAGGWTIDSITSMPGQEADIVAYQGGGRKFELTLDISDTSPGNAFDDCHTYADFENGCPAAGDPDSYWEDCGIYEQVGCGDYPYLNPTSNYHVLDDDMEASSRCRTYLDSSPNGDCDPEYNQEIWCIAVIDKTFYTWDCP